MKILRNIWFVLTINCQKASYLISQSADEPLSTSERIALKSHLLYCRYCTLYKKQMAILIRLFESFRSEELFLSINPKKMSEKKKDEIKRIINQQK